MPAGSWRPLRGAASPRACSTQLLDAASDYAFVSNSDNFGAVARAGSPGWIATEQRAVRDGGLRPHRGRPRVVTCARRRDGRLMLREFSQCPAEELESFQDIGRQRYFNTNTLWVDLRALATSLDETGGVVELPLIVNRKPVDPDQPASPQVIQLETAMGAGLSLFEGCARPACDAHPVRPGQVHQRPAGAVVRRLRADRRLPHRALAAANRATSSSTWIRSTTGRSAICARAFPKARRRWLARAASWCAATSGSTAGWSSRATCR